MSHKDKKPHGFFGFGMVFSCELLVLSPGPHVGFGTVGAGLLRCSDIFQQALIQFKGATCESASSKAGSGHFWKFGCCLGLTRSNEMGQLLP